MAALVPTTPRGLTRDAVPSVTGRIAAALGEHRDPDAAKCSASRWWWITHAGDDWTRGVERKLTTAVLRSHPNWGALGQGRQQHLLLLLRDLLTKNGLARLMSLAMLLAREASQVSGALLSKMCAATPSV